MWRETAKLRASLSGAVLMALLLLVWPAAAISPLAAADGQESFSVLVDPTRMLGVEDVQAKDFKPVVSTFGGGFTTAAYWVRITFHASDPPPLILRFRPTTTDSIQLFSPMPDGTWKRSDAGEIVMSSRDAAHGFGWYAFHIDPAPGQTRYYARITTQSPGAITVMTLDERDELRANARAMTGNAAVLALQLLAIILVLKRLDPLRSLSHFSFLAMSVVFALYLQMFNGFASTALDLRNMPLAEGAQKLLASLTVVGIIAFNYLFLRDYGMNRAIGKAMIVIFILSAISPLLLLCGLGNEVRLSLACATLFVPFLIAAVAGLRHDGPVRLRDIRIVYTVYIGFLILSLVLRLGIIDSRLMYRYSMEAVAIVSATMILALVWLQYRAEQGMLLTREVALAGLSADLVFARDFRAGQLEMVREIEVAADRVHAETRDAMRASAFATDGPRAERSAEALRAVIERCLFAQQAEKEHWRLRPEPFFPAESLRDLCAMLATPERWRLELAEFSLTSDRGLFDLAARNLLSNALVYGRDDRPVHVTLQSAIRRGRAGATLTIANLSRTAQPFDPDRVFDKFYRGPSASNRSGTGLGLGITREALAQIGGGVTLDMTGQADDTQVTARVWVPDR